MAKPLDLRSLRRNPHIVVASLCANLLGLALPLVMIQVYDRIIPREGYATLSVLAIGLAIAALADFGVRMARGRLIAMAGAKYESETYHHAFQRMLQFGSPLASLDHGALHDRMESIERVRKHHGSEAAAALLDIPFIVLFVAVMTMISPALGVTVCALAAASISIVWIQRKVILKLNQDRQERDQRRHSFLVETIEGIEMIKGLGIEPLMQRRYERLMSVNAVTTHDMSSRINMTQGITSAIGLMSPVVMSGIGSLLVIQGQMSVGGVAASVLLTGRVIQPMLRIEALLAGERDTKQSEQHVGELLAAAPSIAGSTKISQVDEISLTGVDIAPVKGAAAVTKNVNFTFRKGDCVALSGSDGSGRSLFLSLLAGCLSPAKGEILLNGVPYPYLHQSVIADRISLLSPDFSMLEGTLLENLTAFDVEKHREQAFLLAQELGIDEFISRHADGLSLRVAARTATSLPKSIHDGVILISGLVKQPDVILFDEANAGLDMSVDKKMVEILRARIPDSIIVMVTHRPSYLALANRTLVFDQNTLSEQARPETDARQMA